MNYIFTHNFKQAQPLLGYEKRPFVYDNEQDLKKKKKHEQRYQENINHWFDPHQVPKKHLNSSEGSTVQAHLIFYSPSPYTALYSYRECKIWRRIVDVRYS